MRRIRIVEGEQALPELERLEPLWAESGTPITARSTWLECYTAAFSRQQPVVVSVVDGARVVAAACLGRVDGPVIGWTALGHAVSDYSALPAVDDDAARRLAVAVAERVAAARRPWRLRLEQVPAGDPVLLVLAGLLPHVRVRPGIGAFRLALTEPREINRHASKSFRRTRAKGVAKLEQDGHDVRTEAVRDAGTVASLLERVVALRRDRDHQMRGYSDFDDREFLQFYRRLLVRLAGRDELELHVLLRGEDLVAYNVGLLDGSTYRVWDGRVHTDWTQYATGRICELATIESVLADPRFTTYDWMRGEQDYKRSSMTHTAHYQHLHAWSSATVQRGARLLDGVVRHARQATRSGGLRRSVSPGSG